MRLARVRWGKSSFAGSLGVTLLAVTQPGAAQTFESCAAITGSAERLACYDRVSGRASPAAPPSAVGSPAPAIPPSIAGKVSAAAPTPPPATGAAPAAPAVPAPVATVASPQDLPPESFGLYSAEHPTIPNKRPTLTAKVIGLGILADTHQSVTLEGGQLWELESADPLLAPGDMVTVKRAALGSFLLKTPSGRIYRAYRLR